MSSPGFDPVPFLGILVEPPVLLQIAPFASVAVASVLLPLSFSELVVPWRIPFVAVPIVSFVPGEVGPLQRAG
jgi:hypothetical protein